MIKTAIDTEAIGKYIWSELYRISSKNGITQTDIAKKMGSTPWYISLMLTGKNTTRNTETYWRIAETIPLTRKEFDQIVEDAKRKVLWVSGGGETEKDPDETIKMALNSKWWTQPEINEMMNFIKFKETNK